MNNKYDIESLELKANQFLKKFSIELILLGLITILASSFQCWSAS